MQENSVKGTDPMQPLEWSHNTKYLKEPNWITDPENSINFRIHYPSECFKEAQVKDIFDNKHIFLVLLGYNLQ